MSILLNIILTNDIMFTHFFEEINKTTASFRIQNVEEIQETLTTCSSRILNVFIQLSESFVRESSSPSCLTSIS